MIIRGGIDIGQMADYTALVIAEMQWREPERKLPGNPMYEDHWFVRHIGRLALGTKYPVIADNLADMIQEIGARVHAGNLANRAGHLVPLDFALIKFYIDATGVGKPVVDMIRKAGAKVTAVYFTHGDRRIEFAEGENDLDKSIRLGKAYMVSRLQVLLQTQRLHLPNTAEARVLAQELLDYEIRVDQNANDKYGAFKVGSHDDLATALGLAVNETPVLVGQVLSTPAFQATVQGMPEAIPSLGDNRVSGLPYGVGTGGLLNAWGETDHALDRFRRN